MRKATINQNICDRSPYCAAARSCPVNAIQISMGSDYKTKIIVDEGSCVGCSRCVLACPHGAIEIKEV